jgi:probable HAF family extracellular repeat protein
MPLLNRGLTYSMKTARFMFVSFLVASPAQPAAAQPQYTVHDLGALNGTVAGINNSGQVIGTSSLISHGAFRTAPNSAIDTARDDLGTLGGLFSNANAINNSGQVVGLSRTAGGQFRAFRTAANRNINPVTDDLGGLFGFPFCSAFGINDSGQAVGFCTIGMAHQNQGFRTAPNRAINSATDDLGTLQRCCFGTFTVAVGINSSGQVAGTSGGQSHAFRTAGNRAINPATDDLGTLGGSSSGATGINDSGQVVGSSFTAGGQLHAFRTAPNNAINPATDDLGTLGGSFSTATGINSSGQVVGFSSIASFQNHAFLYTGGVMYDLNNLIPPNSGWTLEVAGGVNDLGQIVGSGLVNGAQHAFRLDPPAATFVSFLLNLIASFDLPHGTSTDLSSVLGACLNALERGNHNAARNQLGAFENKVSAQREKKLTTGQADLLLNIAVGAIQLLP